MGSKKKDDKKKNNHQKKSVNRLVGNMKANGNFAVLTIARSLCLYISHENLEKIRFVVSKVPKEAQWFHQVERTEEGNVVYYELKGMDIPPQTSSHSEVETTDEQQMERWNLLVEEFGDAAKASAALAKMGAWCHSHHDMQVSPSPQDKTTFETQIKQAIADKNMTPQLMLIFNRRDEYYCQLYDPKLGIIAENVRLVTPPLYDFTDVEKVIESRIVAKKYEPVTSTSSLPPGSQSGSMGAGALGSHYGGTNPHYSGGSNTSYTPTGSDAKKVETPTSSMPVKRIGDGVGVATSSGRKKGEGKSALWGPLPQEDYDGICEAVKALNIETSMKTVPEPNLNTLKGLVGKHLQGNAICALEALLYGKKMTVLQVANKNWRLMTANETLKGIDEFWNSMSETYFDPVEVFADAVEALMSIISATSYQEAHMIASQFHDDRENMGGSVWSLSPAEPETTTTSVTPTESNPTGVDN